MERSVIYKAVNYELTKDLQQNILQVLSKKKTPDVPESSLALQSLRWHYPDQVVGVFLRFRFLVIVRN